MTSTDPRAPDAPICSAKGCRAPATWSLHWNNPRIHTPDRRKTWMACDTHRQPLSDFLAARNFLRETTPHPRPDPPAPSNHSPAT